MRLVLLFLGFLLSGQAWTQDRGNVLVAELRGARVVYEVGGRTRALDDAIALLRERRKETGVSPKDDVAIIVASKDLTINQIQALYSTLQAYGFAEIHVFAFDAAKVRMQEFGFSMQVIPFSKERAQLMKAIGR